MRRFLPYPLLSLAILLFWLLLSGISPGQILLGSLVALFCGQAMTRLQQKKNLYPPLAPAAGAVLACPVRYCRLQFCRGKNYPHRRAEKGAFRLYYCAALAA